MCLIMMISIQGGASFFFDDALEAKVTGGPADWWRDYWRGKYEDAKRDIETVGLWFGVEIDWDNLTLQDIMTAILALPGVIAYEIILSILELIGAVITWGVSQLESFSEKWTQFWTEGITEMFGPQFEGDLGAVELTVQLITVVALVLMLMFGVRIWVFILDVVPAI